MAKITTAAQIKQRLTLAMPAELFDVYSERAAKFHRSPEDEMLQRLTTCASHVSQQPIYIDDDSRRLLEAIAGRQLRTAKDLIAWANNLSTLSVAGTTVPLSEQLLRRLDGRRFGKPLPEFVQQAVIDQLEQFTGMR